MEREGYTVSLVKQMPSLDAELLPLSKENCLHKNCKYYGDHDEYMVWTCKRCQDCHQMWYQYIDEEKAYNCEEVHVITGGGCS